MALTLVAVTWCGSAAADAPEDGTTGSTRAPEQIVIPRPGLYPEGVEWDVKHQRFLVSSAA